jgi:signal transduction histidine kinase/HAMP domain-containing protein
MVDFLSSLRFRLIVLVLLAVIPAVGLILHTAARQRALTAGEVQRNALRAARAISNEQERVLESAHQVMITLSGFPQVREKNRAACDRMLAGLLEPLYADLRVTDLKGNILCSARRSGSSLTRPSASHLKRVIDTQDFSIGDFRNHPSARRTVADLGYPMFDEIQVLRGVVFLSLDLSWVTRSTAENHLHPGASFSLVDSHGTVIVRYPEAEEWVGKVISPADSVKRILSEERDGTLETIGGDGTQRLFAFSQVGNRVGGQTVYAAVDIPAELAFAETKRLLIYNLISLAGLSALTIMAAWFGTDLFVLRRIHDLVGATKQIAAGKLTTRTRLPYGKSELGQLARAFDDLAEALERREIEAKASSEHIEKQRQRQSVLYDINLAITSTLDLESVLSALLGEMAALFPYCAATVSLNNQQGTLESIAQRNFGGEEQRQADVRPDLGLPKAVIELQSPIAVLDARTDPRTASPEFFRRHRMFSYLGLPMIAKGQPLGVLSLYTKEEHQFSREEMDFLMALANQAAVAVYNSRVYEQSKNQAVELEKSNKIKDEFLGVMSHELRTPLNIIMNYAEALSIQMFGKMSPHQEKGVEKIKSQAGHLLSLINEILEITKIESGTATLQKEPVNLANFVVEMESDYVMPMEKPLILNWNYPPDLPMIVSDRLKLKQILTNLINNAIKFTDEGSVTISLRALNGGQGVEFQVADTGPGIPDDLIPVVFDKFRQLDSSTTRNHSGAGLGLYIVKTFTELLGGTISVQSKVGEGTVFTVRLSAAAVSEEAGPSVALGLQQEPLS